MTGEVVRRAARAGAAIPAVLAVTALLALVGATVCVRTSATGRALEAVYARRVAEQAAASAVEEAAAALEAAVNAGALPTALVPGRRRDTGLDALHVPARVALDAVGRAFAADGVTVGPVAVSVSDAHRDVTPAATREPGRVREYGVVAFSFTVTVPRGRGHATCGVRCRRFWSLQPAGTGTTLELRVEPTDLALEVDEA